MPRKVHHEDNGRRQVLHRRQRQRFHLVPLAVGAREHSGGVHYLSRTSRTSRTFSRRACVCAQQLFLVFGPGNCCGACCARAWLAHTSKYMACIANVFHKRGIDRTNDMFPPVTIRHQSPICFVVHHAGDNTAAGLVVSWYCSLPFSFSARFGSKRMHVAYTSTR